MLATSIPDYRGGFAAAFSSAKTATAKTAAPSLSSSALLSSTRREVLSEAMMIGSAVSLASFAVVAPANAVSEKKQEKDQDSAVVPTLSKASSFQGVYTDPKHPKGYRVITSTSMTLSDGGKDAVVYRDLPLKSSKDKNENNGATLLTLDFSIKGGPENAVGIFENNGNLDYTIRFPDGNLWTKRLSVEGVYESSTSKKVRAIYKETGAGSNLQTVTLKDGKEGSDPKIFATKLNNKSGEIQFTDFDDNLEVVGKYSKGIITFPDGHYWTKL